MSNIMPAPYSCRLDPDTKVTLKVYLFKNVKNTNTIRNNVTGGGWCCAVVKPALVVHPLQLAAAANRAALARASGSMRARTVYAELLYNLSLTKNIVQSLKTFGIEDGQDMFVCFLVSADEDYSTDILPQINGELCDMSELKSFTDLKKVRIAYKLNSSMSDNDVLDVIVSKMVTKNFVTN